MIYITGDTHADYKEFMSRLSPCQLTSDDIVIVTGDFGFVWSLDSHTEMLRQLSEKEYTIAFIDGNHEDFPLIYSYPTEEWNGGKIHRIFPNIVHLKRGQLFTIEGRTFFTMGGAYSIDRAFKTKNYSYWDDELPDNTDYKTASDTLKCCGFAADYIITHTAPESMLYYLGTGKLQAEAELSGYLEWIKREVSFKEWYFGHFHCELDIDNCHCLYSRVIPLN